MSDNDQSHIAEELRRHHLFSGLEEQQFDRVLRSMNRHELEAGEHLFEQAQQADYFYLVRRGRMKLYRLSPGGGEKVIDIVNPGQTFAEAIMFMDRQYYPVAAEALLPTEVLAFSNEDFRGVLENSPEVCFQLMADMSRRLRRHLNEIDALTLQNASLRFLHYLHDHLPPEQEGSARLELDAPKNVIASLLSIQPESFSRILRSLGKQGLIRVKGNVIEVEDIDRLRQHLL